MKINKTLLLAVISVATAFFVFGADWIFVLRKAHSTFENYYTFRGCAGLISKTDDYGFCRLNSGQTIKIIKFKNKWYLSGDLPCGFLCF